MKTLDAIATNTFPMGGIGERGLIAITLAGEIKNFTNYHGEKDNCAICGREIDCGWSKSATRERYCIDCVVVINIGKELS